MKELFKTASRAVRSNGGMPWFALTKKGQAKSGGWLASEYFPRHVSRELKADLIGKALRLYWAHDALKAKQYFTQIEGIDPSELEAV